MTGVPTLSRDRCATHSARNGGVMRNAPNRDLSALIGRTRAAVLEAIADGGTTSTVAQRLGISAASASEHATVLREAGLVVSIRQRNHMHHSLTRLGADLLGLQVFGPRGRGAQRRPVQVAVARHPPRAYGQAVPQPHDGG